MSIDVGMWKREEVNADLTGVQISGFSSLCVYKQYTGSGTGSERGWPASVNEDMGDTEVDVSSQNGVNFHTSAPRL